MYAPIVWIVSISETLLAPVWIVSISDADEAKWRTGQGHVSTLRYETFTMFERSGAALVFPAVSPAYFTIVTRSFPCFALHGLLEPEPCLQRSSSAQLLFSTVAVSQPDDPYSDCKIATRELLTLG
jgi:hypothetical protein